MKDIINAVIEAEEFIDAAVRSKSPKAVDFIEIGVQRLYAAIADAEKAKINWMKTFMASKEAIAERAMLRKERMDAAKEGRRVTERRKAERASVAQENVTVGSFEDDFGIFA